jgi:hypothetical protein
VNVDNGYIKVCASCFCSFVFTILDGVCNGVGCVVQFIFVRLDLVVTHFQIKYEDYDTKEGEN